ncbi:hypothetical protein CQ12_10725 [Bradyrhizobium jicamae]|uniref:DUF5343 domain-containing protein n=1 Tax=Bradyrhizobium jicamae TaxID=280332 RepID=A0A0R3MBJ0_9BRAD|nr:DUF5343 domain-containing protein [Bradyrhizobium jicamae]KRR14598.1 hypothetical protein CQ12_10725 [Bradyrhizobium jicamae]
MCNLEQSIRTKEGCAVPAYPYVPSPEKVIALLKKIEGMGIPQKFTNKTLKSLGFTSSNDQRLLGVIKFIGLVDQSGGPAPLWSEYRRGPKTALAKAVRAAYSDLFQHFPNANERDAEALRTYFAASSSLGSVAVGQMVSTFKALCQLGDFSTSDGFEDNEIEPAVRVKEIPAARQAAINYSGAGELTVNINIQLQLPADATADTYDRFFEAMRKHLLAPA